MSRRWCDGDGLLGAYRGAVENLAAHVDEVNALNVYPVPDGDTGSNMVATVRAAMEEAERVTERTVERVGAAISFGALMGARGNSGVIASQIFRGMAEAAAGKRRINGADLAHALSQGSATAYKAVVKPVEGTILTVIREAAAAAVATAEADGDLEAVLTASVEAAERAVAKTPSLLPILREAGVVDAGGQGLYRLMQGALQFLVAQESGHAVAAGKRAAGPRASALVAHADEGYGYETMFLLQAQDSTPLDLDRLRAELERVGNSVLVAGDARAVKVHVHNERPDQVLSLGLAMGKLSRISVENLDAQAQDLRGRRSAETLQRARTDGPPPAATAAPIPDAAAAGSNGSKPHHGEGDAIPPQHVHEMPVAIAAVASGDGLARIFDSFGVARIVRGGQGENPSTGELLAAVADIPAEHILLLPNNPNVVMAARQVGDITQQRVRVVSTRNAAEGFAALLAFDPARDATANAEVMTLAGRSVQTLQVTEAVRDASIGGRKVKKGQTIVLDPDDGLMGADGDRMKAIQAALEALEPGFELITLYYGEGADLAEAETVARRLGEWRTGIEVEVIHGGQPHYRYLISAE